jgi:glycosyltransferase involved in cell wall biosynthesis
MNYLDMNVEKASRSITAVVPTFRRPKLLARSVLSALAQTHADIKVSVYDDNSEDNTREVVQALRAHDSRVEYHEHRNRLGYRANTNYAIKSITTPYFSILADDDLLLPEFYFRALQLLELYPTALCAAGVVLRMDEKGTARPDSTIKYRAGYHDAQSAIQQMSEYGNPNWVGCLFRREAMDEVGDIDTGLSAIDYDFQLRCACAGGIVISHEPWAVFWMHEGSISGSPDLRRHFKLIWPSHFITQQKIRNSSNLSAREKSNVCSNIQRQLTWDLWVLAVKAQYVEDKWLSSRIRYVLRRKITPKALTQIILLWLLPLFKGALFGYAQALYRSLFSPKRKVPPVYFFERERDYVKNITNNAASCLPVL